MARRAPPRPTMAARLPPSHCTTMASNYPPEATPDLLDTFTDYCLAHGLTVRHASDPNAASPAPVSLYPSLFPRRCFDNARAVMPAYNDVYLRIASDSEWLGQLVSEYGTLPALSAMPAAINGGQAG